MRVVIQRVSEACVRVPAEGYESAIGLTWEKNAAEYIALYKRLLR